MPLATPADQPHGTRSPGSKATYTAAGTNTRGPARDRCSGPGLLRPGGGRVCRRTGRTSSHPLPFESGDRGYDTIALRREYQAPARGLERGGRELLRGHDRSRVRRARRDLESRKSAGALGSPGVLRSRERNLGEVLWPAWRSLLLGRVGLLASDIISVGRFVFL